MEKVTVKKTCFVSLGRRLFLAPNLKGKQIFLALDWLTRVNFSPLMRGICINK